MDLSDFHFIRPLWLLALIPLVGVVWLSWHKKWRIGNWQAVCDAELLPYLLQEQASSLHKRGYAPLALAALLALLAVISLAGPTWQRLPAPVFRNESALVIALNLSITMEAADITPSRLVRARYKIADLLKRRKDGQTALLVYAGDAFVVTPLTTDSETIISQLSALTTDIMPSPGNNMAVALEKADDLFRQAGLTKGQIIVVTDAVDLQKTQGVAEQSAKAGYNVSVLAVGTEEGAPIASAAGGFLKDPQGTIVIPKLLAANLRKLASSGGGTYQAITTNDTDVQALLGYTDQARASSEGAKADNQLALQQWDDKGPWLVLAVVPFAALLFRKGLLCWLLLMLLPLPKNTYALAWQDLWQTKDQQAQTAYQQQQYDKAAEWFDNPDWKAAAQYKAGAYEQAQTTLHTPASATSAYNLGNALAQSGKLQEAIKAYDKALSLKPDDEDAKYNKALVEKELQKQQQKQQQQNNDPQQNSQKDGQQDPQQKSQSGQDQQDKGGEPKASDNDQKPEQKPEKSGDQSEAKQADQKQAEQDKQQGEEKQAQPASPKEEQPKENPSQKPKYASEAQQLSAEQQQANEQWLKRIPDDPSGLLKRKFKYQYGQRRPVQ